MKINETNGKWKRLMAKFDEKDKRLSKNDVFKMFKFLIVIEATKEYIRNRSVMVWVYELLFSRPTTLSCCNSFAKRTRTFALFFCLERIYWIVYWNE